MSLRTTVALLALVGLSAGAGAQDAPAPAAQAVEAAPQPLVLGAKAPALNAQAWLKGDQVSEFESGKVYVVEFWATWCPPCIASIPHLTKLQGEHGDKVEIIGMTTGDTRGNTFDAVKTFVAEPPSEMGYTVAFDNERDTWNAYMAASGQGGIPTSFIVNQEGRIAWIGHPMEMDEPLQQIVDGEFDLDAAVEANTRRVGLEQQAAPMLAEVQALMQGGDVEGALVKIDEIVALDNELFAELAFQKFQFLAQTLQDHEGALAYGRRLIDEVLAHSPEMINGLSWSLLNNEGALPEGYTALGVYGADKANELTGGNDPMVLDTVARARFVEGKNAEAVEIQRRVVELAEADADFIAEQLEELRARLASYEAAAE